MNRSLRIEKVPNSPLVCIKWNGGGELPKELSGHFTTMMDARRAIEVWQANNGKDVKEESPSMDEARRTVKVKGEVKPII